MTEKRFDVVMNEFDEVEYITDIVDCEDRDFADFIDFANEMAEENEELKQCLNEAKNDEKQLSIDFMGFKMKLIEQLQIHYDYASEQRQKNLDNLLIAKAYDIIRYDVRKLAEEMGVDLE